MANSYMRWSEIHRLPVTIPSAGRQVGIVEDFYFGVYTSGIAALLVKADIIGTRLLTSTYISAITPQAVTIPGNEVLIERLPNSSNTLPGHQLLNYTLATESGRDLGKVADLLILIEPTSALRIAGIIQAGTPGILNRRPKTFSTDNIVHIEPVNNKIILFDQES